MVIITCVYFSIWAWKILRVWKQVDCGIVVGHPRGIQRGSGEGGSVLPMGGGAMGVSFELCAPLRLELLHNLKEGVVHILAFREAVLDLAKIRKGIIGGQFGLGLGLLDLIEPRSWLLATAMCTSERTV